MTPTVIADADRLAAATERLAAEPRLALDTEFFRERTYVAELALVQLAGADGIELVDPLAGVGLEPLAELLRGPTPLKVLHAARQDVEVLLPLTGVPLAPLLDTQLAAALLGMPAQIGYADLVAREFGHGLEKSQARTDWTRRPLSRAQLEYAADDVRWLLPLAERLEERLATRGRLGWLAEDCAALTDPALYRVDPGTAWQRLKGVESLPPAEQQRLRALAGWRESRAVRRNLPRGWVLSDDGLRAVARAAPPNVAALKALDIMPPGAADKLGAEIITALTAAADLSLEGIVQRAELRPSREEQELTRRLADRLRAVALELGLASEVLATQRDLRRIARGEPAAAVLRGWRAGVLATPLAADAARG